ncbi:hypothetical protein P4115_06995 [Pseudomonas aeruginosa]|nr:hypothetical protein [Pseudomonas aeruginosa]
MKPYEHPAYSDPVVSNEEPDRDCHEWNFEPGDSDQEPYPEYHGANTEECPGGGTQLFFSIAIPDIPIDPFNN